MQYWLAPLENALNPWHGGFLLGCWLIDWQQDERHLQILKDYFSSSLIYDIFSFFAWYIKWSDFYFAKSWILFMIMILILCNIGTCMGTCTFPPSKSALWPWKCWHMALWQMPPMNNNFYLVKNIIIEWDSLQVCLYIYQWDISKVNNFVQMIHEPKGEKWHHLMKCQKSAWKDLKHYFRVL